MTPQLDALSGLTQRADLGPWERCFLLLLAQVWEVEPEASPTTVWVHFADGDVAWFRRYMAADTGDSATELEALETWLRLRTKAATRPAARNGRLLAELEMIQDMAEE